MPRPDVPHRSRAWPRVAAFALIAIGAAGCSDSGRFDENVFSNPFASKNSSPQQQQDVTGSVSRQPQPSTTVARQPLPAPSQPATVAANGPSYGAYRPSARTPDVTGSINAQPAPAGWSWDGGTPVTVERGDTIASISRKYGVPSAAIMQTNAIANPASIRPGQRIVIPRYSNPNSVEHTGSVRAPVKPSNAMHVVEPGEGLMAVARRYGVAHDALARANNLDPYAALKVGDRLTIPAGGRTAARSNPAPQVSKPRTVAPPKMAQAKPENARLASPQPAESNNAAKNAEPIGALPTFRWPVRGRIIAGFGRRLNGQQNDGINLAVPEGTPVKAAEDGVVAYAGNELKGYGNLVLVRHPNGYVSAYAHASEITVKRGDTVKRGQVIARSGQTGNVTSPQLHFEIRKGSTPVDPKKYLSGA